jgi:hypothetical protein
MKNDLLTRIGVSVTLQLMTLAFSSYFELISLAAADQHGRLDKNDITSESNIR